MLIKILYTLGCLVLAWVAFIGVIYLFQSKMIYLTRNDKVSLADSAVSGFNEITVTTKDGLPLYGWYKPAARTDGATVVFFHGNASNLVMESSRAAAFDKAGYGLLLVEYRGYRGNPGRPDERGLYDDAHAFIDWLQSAQGLKEEQIILNGQSLGTGIAVQMALDYPGVRALILESPYTTLVEVAAHHYKYLPVRLLMRDKFDSLSKIKDIKTLLIVAHGTKDVIVPYSDGKALFDAAPQPKTLITLEGAGHLDLADFGSDEKIIGALSE